MIGYSRPLVLELALQARNVQRDELRVIAESWGSVRGCFTWKPRISKRSLGKASLEKALPEMFEDFPEEGPRLIALDIDPNPLKDQERDFLKRLRVDKVKTWEEVPWIEVISKPNKEMWAHAGRCLFSMMCDDAESRPVIHSVRTPTTLLWAMQQCVPHH